MAPRQASKSEPKLIKIRFESLNDFPGEIMGGAFAQWLARTCKTQPDDRGCRKDRAGNGRTREGWFGKGLGHRGNLERIGNDCQEGSRSLTSNLINTPPFRKPSPHPRPTSARNRQPDSAEIVFPESDVSMRGDLTGRREQGWTRLPAALRRSNANQTNNQYAGSSAISALKSPVGLFSTDRSRSSPPDFRAWRLCVLFYRRQKIILPPTVRVSIAKRITPEIDRSQTGRCL